MDFSKFDEFGNPIDENSSESDSSEDEAPNDIITPVEPMQMESILVEDKKHYPDPREVYPSYTKIKHEDEDRQDYTEPVIPPLTHRVIASDLKKTPATTFSSQFLLSLFEDNTNVRNIAFVGTLGHGKTEFIDCLVRETHPGIAEKLVTQKDITNQVLGTGRNIERLGWTDRLYLEKRRKMSILTDVVTLVDQNLDGQSVALNLIDTPGHPDFVDQVITGMSMADGIAFVVDAVEGVTRVAQKLLLQVVLSEKPIILIITKIDRLILELKLPPTEAFKKLRRVVEEVNTSLLNYGYAQRLSPELFNVLFASPLYSFCISTELAGRMYCKTKEPSREFASRLWGDYRIDISAIEENGVIREKAQIIHSSNNELDHPFVKYVLEPLYKVFTTVLSYEPEQWSKLLRIHLTSHELKLNSAPLLRIALSRVYGSFSPFVTIAQEKLPMPHDIETQDSTNPNQVALVSKFVPNSDGSNIYALVRIFRGKFEPGSTLFANNPASSIDDGANQQVQLGSFEITHTRYFTPVNIAFPGMIIKISGTNPNFSGISTLTDIRGFSLPSLVIPSPLMKIAIEPLNEGKLQEMIDSISYAQLCYPSLSVKVEANKEHTLLGTGQMYLDCVMNDIRNSFASIEIKVSDPFVVLSETIKNRDSQICIGEIEEGVYLGVIAEPMRDPILYDLEIGKLGNTKDKKAILMSDGMDLLDASNVWCFGPDSKYGPNMLIDGTLPPKSEMLNRIRPLIENSFRWATSSGPLCDGLMRGVVFRIIEAQLGEGRMPISAKVISSMRKAIMASFLAGQPQLMEPIYTFEVMTTHLGVRVCKELVQNRRGKFLYKKTIPGTPLHLLVYEVPLIDSFGLDVEIRARTMGQAFPLSYFEKWDYVPGDPLDSTIQLKPLEISPDYALAREFMVKNRRRKGYPDDIDLSKYFSNEQLIELASYHV